MGIDARKQLTCLGSCRMGRGFFFYMLFSSKRLHDRRPGQRVQNDRSCGYETGLQVVDSAVKWLRDAFAPGHDHTDRECSGFQGVCTPTSQVPRRMACCAVRVQLYKDTPSL